MLPNKGILQSELFYINHLDPSDANDLNAIGSFEIFAPEGQGLDIYLKYSACRDELSNEMRTYLVRDLDTDECVGYFSLKAGLISINETEPEREDFLTGEKKQFENLILSRVWSCRIL